MFCVRTTGMMWCVPNHRNVQDVCIQCHVDELMCTIWCAMSHTFEHRGHQQVNRCMHHVLTNLGRPLLPCCWGCSFGLFFFWRCQLPCISFSSLCLSHDYHLLIISLNMFELSQPPVHTEQFERDTVVPVLGINLLGSSGSWWSGAYGHLCAQHRMSVGHQSNLMQFVSKKMQGFHKWGTSKCDL